MLFPMARLNSARQPTASTVEVADILNGSKKQVDTASLRRKSNKQPVKTPEVEERPKSSTRTSPRKRKEAPSSPTAELRHHKLPRRSTRAGQRLSEGGPAETSTVVHGRSPPSVEKGPRTNIYDVPETNKEQQPAAVAATTSAPKRQKGLTRKPAKDRFQGQYAIELPASSPAEATRSHDRARQTSGDQRNEPRATVKTQQEKGLGNFMARAARDLEERETVDIHQQPVALSGVRRGRSSKGAQEGPGRHPTTGTVPAAREVETNPANNQSDADGGEPHNSTNEAHTETRPDPSEEDQNEMACAGMEAEDANAIAGIEEAASLYGCTNDWTKLLVYAKKAARCSTRVKPKQIREILDMIKGIKIAYNKIYHGNLSEQDLNEAEIEIDERNYHLKRLRVEAAVADPKEHDLNFVELLYQRVIPRMVFMMKNTLQARYNKEKDDISVGSLEELVSFMDMIFAFRNLAEKAPSKPSGLTNDNGDYILPLVKSALAGLKIVRKKYIRLIANHKVAVEGDAEARRREIDIHQKQAHDVAMQQQRLKQNAEEYEKKLQKEREKRADAARRLAEVQTEGRRKLEQGLMLNRSFGAEILRKKLGLPGPTFRRNGAHKVGPKDQETVFDVDNFDLDDNFEPIKPLPVQIRLNDVRYERPRPRREPTEEIPAPVIEPQWTDEQIEALVWGLRTHRGRDRYQNMLHEPEVKGILRGKSILELQTQSLYIKQSMARAMGTGVLPSDETLQDDWSWLRSV